MYVYIYIHILYMYIYRHPQIWWFCTFHFGQHVGRRSLKLLLKYFSCRPAHFDLDPWCRKCCFHSGSKLRRMEEILHQLIGGKHPIIFRFSTIQGDAGFRNHPQYHHLSSLTTFAQPTQNSASRMCPERIRLAFVGMASKHQVEMIWESM